MKRIVKLASVAALTIAVGTIEANSFERTLELKSSVLAACTVGTIIENEFAQTGENSFGYTVINDNGSVDAQTVSIEFNDVNCNTGAVEVSLTSDNSGLTNQSGGDAKIHYTANARLGNDSPFVILDTTAAASASDETSLGATPLSVSVSFAATDSPLPAGEYSDNLRISINPGS